MPSTYTCGILLVETLITHTPVERYVKRGAPVDNPTMNDELKADDARTAAQNLAEIEQDLRDVHGPPVVETDSVIIFADDTGHELNEIAEYEGLSRGDVSEWMHTEARKHHDRARCGGDAWSVSDPIVVLKEN